jgi:hypothetical protein
LATGKPKSDPYGWNDWLDNPGRLVMDEDESYHFVWHGAFDPTVACRVFSANGETKLIARRATSRRSDHGGDNFRWLEAMYKQPPEIVERDLSSSEWGEICREVRRAGLWEMPTTSERAGLDGGTWVLHLRQANRQHRIERWSPEENDLFREFCAGLLVLAGFGGQNIY